MTETAAFARAFAAAFGAGDAGAMAGLFAEDAALHSLTGQFLQGRKAIATGLAAEFAGLCRQARLVSGKAGIRPMGPGAAILHQRFVVTGLRGEDGAELPRIGALLTVVLAAREGGWQALTATFAMLAD